MHKRTLTLIGVVIVVLAIAFVYGGDQSTTEKTVSHWLRGIATIAAAAGIMIFAWWVHRSIPDRKRHRGRHGRSRR